MHLRLAWLTLVVAVAVGFGTGCSCGGHGAAVDAGPGDDAPVQFDAVRDSTPVNDDAGPTCGTFQVPNGCGFELTACTVAKDSSDECLGLDCVNAGLYGLVCLRKCTCSAECGVNTICLPGKTTDYTSATDPTKIIGNARAHCFYSFCGGAGDDTSPFGNGNFFGACDLGKDAFIKPGKVDTRAGTCFPLSTDVPTGYLKLGICQEAGAKPRGAACTFDMDQCTDPTTFDKCAVGSTCIGRAGQATGTCAKLCNPNAVDFNPAVPGDCAADAVLTHDQNCQDSSSYQRECTESDGGVPAYSDNIFYNYVGFCVDSAGCDLFAAASCANVTSDGGVAQNGCEPTNPINPYGLCDRTGTVALGDPCNTTNLCQAGLVCITWPGQSQGTCEKYCGLGANSAKWPCTNANEYCSTILYGADPTPGRRCDDDPYTLGFGVCKPDTRQDGGV